LAKKTNFIRNLVSHYNGKGIVVPRIRRPITKRQERKVRKHLKKLKVKWQNCVSVYRKIQKFVKKLIRENERY